MCTVPPRASGPHRTGVHAVVVPANAVSSLVSVATRTTNLNRPVGPFSGAYPLGGIGRRACNGRGLPAEARRAHRRGPAGWRAVRPGCGRRAAPAPGLLEYRSRAAVLDRRDEIAREVVAGPDDRPIAQRGRDE